MDGVKKLSHREVNLIGRIIDAIEDEALKMRRNRGEIMTAEQAVLLLKNHAAVGRDFEERTKVSDSIATVSTTDDARKEDDNGNP